MNHMRTWSVVLVAALTAACGAEPEEAAIDAAPATQPAVSAVAEDSTERMARAVGAGKPGAAVDLKYEFASKPELGVPVEVEVALIPTSGVESMTLTVSGMEGITLAGELQYDVSQARAGEVYRHTFSVLPEQAGVYYVTAVVTTTFSSATLARTFSIPFVVGSPPPAAKATAEGAADEEAVESLPAQESSR
ncbi:MAG: hypothetical protein DIU71_15050 [Proteobacteria bacterium]|nr:MAG: hypothetical protein DIU71_15050 [Pseudomonadota bacterium]